MAKQKNSGNGKFRVEKKKNLTALDPHLQDCVLRHQAGEELSSSLVSTAADGTVQVDVVGKLENPAKKVEGLHIVTANGPFITGTVDIDRIEAVRRDPNVVTLKSATELHPDLEFSVPDIRATQDQIRAALPVGTPSDGAGVLVGVVDYGCDFNHRNFRHADGSTRLLAIWDQRGGTMASSPRPYGYGRELTQGQIDAALQSEDPYQALRYNPGTRAHGTHVADIAAGNGNATGHPGVAPGADLVFVQIAADDLDDEESFGNSRQLIEAVDYIARKARELGKSAVVNISLGTHGGPHDGSTPAEQTFDYMMENQPGLAVVVSAGNSWRRRSHAMGTVEPGGSRTLGWHIRRGDRTDNEVEVWYTGGDELAVTLVTPDGQRIGPVELGTTVTLHAGDELVGRIIHRKGDPNNGDNQVDILLRRDLQGGWQIELGHVAGSGDFHAWIERDDFGQSAFAQADESRSFTLGSISCGRKTLVVGSYDALDHDRDISSFSSEGPTRDGRQKPEISAPGGAVLAARSRSQGRTRMSGTSMAAPHVTGLVALVMAAAPQKLEIDEIREAIAGTARSVGNFWHARFGEGRADARAAVADVGRASDRPAAPDARAAAVPAAGGNGHGTPSLTGLLEEAVASAAAAGAHLRIEVEIDRR